MERSLRLSFHYLQTELLLNSFQRVVGPISGCLNVVILKIRLVSITELDLENINDLCDNGSCTGNKA